MKINVTIFIIKNSALLVKIINLLKHKVQNYQMQSNIKTEIKKKKKHKYLKK